MCIFFVSPSFVIRDWTLDYYRCINLTPHFSLPSSYKFILSLSKLFVSLVLWCVYFEAETVMFNSFRVDITTLSRLYKEQPFDKIWLSTKIFWLSGTFTKKKSQDKINYFTSIFNLTSILHCVQVFSVSHLYCFMSCE